MYDISEHIILDPLFAFNDLAIGSRILYFHVGSIKDIVSLLCASPPILSSFVSIPV